MNPAEIIEFYCSKYFDALLTKGGEEAKSVLFNAICDMDRIAKKHFSFCGREDIRDFDPFVSEAHKNIMLSLFKGGGKAAHEAYKRYMTTSFNGIKNEEVDNEM